ncbi:hypothetical protein PFICI_10309 [Pestalotiopsis fici W106-1]|uniref:Uncharacterized protein n=1 Tax=Pestalotiopsis fici (strain W106-1 / CGMCC3.15140) TaxID=1229662 RepID=W3WYS3_PESFW|nr:uncharacterized protein PFICI_10309 [Pestalotiopsis fici W106-1]ETS78247.1 hypothetical protein PFICI_10309 [Pestalotiopsis fici W106-1]
MAEVLSNTPSPPPRVRTPQTPKFGAFGDNWEPYSPRKSTRIANRTPSPQSAAVASRSNATLKKTTISTPGTSPQKKRAPAMDSVTRAPRATHLAPSSARSAPTSAPQSKSTNNLSVATMLPTPSKTPRKQPDDNLEAGVRAVARNLFASESSSSNSVASPRKRKTKTYTGLSLESFRAEEVEEDITIFTDSRDRLPEVDGSAENPFYGNTEDPQPTSTRRSTRVKKVSIPGVGRVPVEEAVQRGDGIVYVFRGKTFWKPREDGIPHNEDENELDGSTVNVDAQASSPLIDRLDRLGSPPRRITRSSIKPRLLFPAQEKKKASHDTDEEEAATDIEDHANPNPTIIEPEEEQSQTPQEPQEKIVPDTPAAPRFAPASPPASARATRVSKRLLAEETPAKRTGRRSPFDSWRRSKTGTASHGQKREAESSPPREATSKRLRG